MNRISESELMRLRGVAFEYLPVVQAKMLAQDRFLNNHIAYYSQLYTTATIQVKRSITAIELASIRLLQALASHALYDENNSEQQCEGITSQEMIDSTLGRLAHAIKELSRIAGRPITSYISIETDKGDYGHPRNTLNTKAVPEENTAVGLVNNEKPLSYKDLFTNPPKTHSVLYEEINENLIKYIEEKNQLPTMPELWTYLKSEYMYSHNSNSIKLRSQNKRWDWNAFKKSFVRWTT